MVARKLSVLKPRVRKLIIFSFIFLQYNFEDTVSYFDKDMFKKNLSVVQILIVK